MFMPKFSLLTARYSGRRDREEREPERQLAGVLAQHHQPGSMFIGLGARRGTAATT